MEHLHAFAEHIGVSIEYANLNHLNRVGDYCTHRRRIRIQQGMLARKERSVLAHELGHAVHDDQPSILEHLNQRQEERADEWAAHFLINETEYREAETLHSSNTAAIAQELCVLERIVEAYERTLHRIGDTVYVKPNLGVAHQKIRA